MASSIDCKEGAGTTYVLAHQLPLPCRSESQTSCGEKMGGVEEAVTIHIAIGHFRFVPMLLPLHETITSLGSNLGTHRPFNTLYSNPRWDLCTVRARSPFPIPPHIYTTLLVYTFPHSEY